MFSSRSLGTGLVFVVVLAVGLPAAHSQDQTGTRRKYKAPPDTSHIEVEVLKSTNQKPLVNAAVIFHAVKDGKDEGNLEVKTNDEGKAVIDVIATGSDVEIQVIADGYATFAGDYQVNEPSKAIQIKMIRPRAQVSLYQDNSGKAAQRPVGVQEPATPATLPGTPVNAPPAKAAPPPVVTPPPSTPPGV